VRILLFGKSGQLGQELLRSLPLIGEVFAPGRSVVDVASEAAVRDVIRTTSPEIIVNASAYTAVDEAEKNHDLAFQVNARAPGLMAREAARLNIGLIHFSTDYVFDGAKQQPYREPDEPHPLNVYGQSKLEGEQAIAKAGAAHLVFRTSWVYRLLGSHACFPKKLISWAKTKPDLRVVDDQIGTPTWARDLAQALVLLIAGDTGTGSWRPRATGLYHLASAGSASRYDWARLTFDELGMTSNLHRAHSDEFNTPAKRPTYSVLSCEEFHKTFGFSLPDWETSYRLALSEL
jgi:dTDP-4-dehydrorhamnose reductase